MLNIRRNIYIFLLSLLNPKGVDFPSEKTQQTKNRDETKQRTEENRVVRRR